MQVTLKFKGLSEAPISVLDPCSKTIVVNWEIESEMPWYDTDGKFDRVVHQIKPIFLERKFTPTYERISNGSTN